MYGYWGLAGIKKGGLGCRAVGWMRGRSKLYDLAWGLNVTRIEFVPITGTDLAQSLDSGYCDIVMSAVVVNAERLETMKGLNAPQPAWASPGLSRIPAMERLFVYGNDEASGMNMVGAAMMPRAG